MMATLLRRRPRSDAGVELEIEHCDVVREVQRRHLGDLPRRRLRIRSRDLASTPFRDIVDLRLALARRPAWAWCDDSGRLEPGRSMPRALAALAREALIDAPASYLRHRRRLGTLERELPLPRPQPIPAERLRRALYVRADHELGLVAGGALAHAAGVIGGLRTAGVAVQVVSPGPIPGIPMDHGFQALPPVYAPVANVPELPELEYTDALMRLAQARWGDWRPDFVYVRYSRNNYLGPWLRARFGVPFVCEYNGSSPWMRRHWEGKPLRFEATARRVEDLNLRSADLVVVVSQALAEEVVRRGVAQERVLVNPNGVDPERYRPDAGAGEVRRTLGLEGRIVVGFIGTFGPWHGVEPLVEAAGLLREDLPALHFLLIGDGPRMEPVRRRIRELGVESRFTLTGAVPQDRGPAYLAACDILASPHVPNPDGSRFFGSPTKLFEYMATGRAIVASALEQIGEVLRAEETALLIPPGDVPALAAAIRRLAADAALRARLGSAARAAAIRDHTWNAHAGRIVAALTAAQGAET